MSRPAVTVRRARALVLLTTVLALLVGLFPGVAAAYVPPPPQGAITDTSGKLSAEDDRQLEEHVAAYRARTTNELAVLVVGSLGNETIDDVAYAAFNGWGVGKKGTDNGVLLVIAPNQRKMRIETGKGVGDRLTDIESSHILRERVGPLLKQERFREAILAGLEGIETALDKGGAAGAGPRAPAARSTSIVTTLLPFLVLGVALMVFVALGAVVVSVMRQKRARAAGGAAGGSSSDSSYSSQSSQWSSGSGGSSGGSDFGGGSSGGGGSSDSY